MSRAAAIGPADEPGPERCVVFLHAHPDDEAIFTGGTMALLARAGWRVVLVVATAGEEGETSAPEADVALGIRRRDETQRSAECLAAQRVEFLGYRDSGLDGAGAASGGRENAAGVRHRRPPGAFADAPVDEAADRLARILIEERPRALVGYDARGIYGHVDHVQVHRVAAAAATQAGVATLYESTVDREYLHFVETHLVVEATIAAQPERVPLGFGLSAAPLGLSTVEVDCTVDVRPVLAVKRRAMAAHASQIPASSSALRLPDADFAAVYGYEWYARRGPLGPIDELA